MNTGSSERPYGKPLLRRLARPLFQKLFLACASTLRMLAAWLRAQRQLRLGRRGGSQQRVSFIFALC